ncbi:dipeptidase [Diaphorobacter aerolatus]|uniref:Dipeptidase n=1 Tax=Diaphorobacter aerolatus TaxID=1288495 RepID=A0A7H0GHL6_9BURK|nr:dipeptidase [Diaphorobacter aerolatus]QNP47782.1 dipeptidase [Diaphorobacter aerolatus]
MKPQFRRCVVALGVALGMTLMAAPAIHAETLKKPALDAIAARAMPGAVSFPEFLKGVAQQHPDIAPAVQRYVDGQQQALQGDDLVNIARLLGLYTRLTQEARVLASIEQMVALPTVRDAKIPPHENPSIIEFGQLVERMARDFGLQYRNVDNRIFEVTLPGSGRDEFGILTHADVVPVVAAEWVIDGRQIDPFKVTRVGDKLYGRGTIDDKGSIATVLYAMKAVKDSRLPLARGIRLMIETTEETGGDAMKYYREKTTLPEHNIVLDSKYPAVVAEKGTGAIKAFFADVQSADAQQPTMTAMAGAASSNAIAQTATASIEAGDATALAAVARKLQAARDGFVDAHQKLGKFSIDIATGANKLDIKVTGTSAHGSRPEEGVNPVPRLALFMEQTLLQQAAGEKALLQRNQYTDAVRYINAVYGLDYFGNALKLAYADDFMGPLTISPNFIKASNGQLEVTANARMPRGRSPEELKASVEKGIADWSAAAKVPVKIDYTQGNWMARDPRGAWLATLLNIFGDTTGLDAKPVPTAGSTTAKLMPNAINFGPAMPGKKYTAHNALEYKEVPDLQADMQMFTEMLVRIGNLQQMQ